MQLQAGNVLWMRGRVRGLAAGRFRFGDCAGTVLAPTRGMGGVGHGGHGAFGSWSRSRIGSPPVQWGERILFNSNLRFETGSGTRAVAVKLLGGHLSLVSRKRATLVHIPSLCTDTYKPPNPLP